MNLMSIFLNLVKNKINGVASIVIPFEDLNIKEKSPGFGDLNLLLKY